MTNLQRVMTAMIGVVAVCGIVASSAMAQAFEPNDSFVQASGPLSGGQNYEAMQETQNDADFFFFNTTAQRQIDVSLTELAGNCGSGRMLDSNGDQVASAFVEPTIGHIRFSSPRAEQYVLAFTSNSQGCRYRFRIDPADAISTSSPGIAATVSNGQTDDLQRILLNGQLVMQVQGSTRQSVSLGHLPASSTITFEAENLSGGFDWDVVITNQTERVKTTIFSERDGLCCPSTIGLVRRVVITPSGGILESCGEQFAPVRCIVTDSDADGSPAGQDCNDASATIRPGAAEIRDNDVDENCDGVVARTTKHTTTMTFRRRRARYSGRARSTSRGCLNRRQIVLRRVGSGTRSFGRARTRPDGTFTFNRRRRLRGRVYAVAAESRRDLTLCRVGRSFQIRG